ncbi:hypothetical protein LJY25_07350 [Hymenobacter sp. BT175]|uniref:hypothetical protein n=1 Tax=Hymenobacter translucens TaxID=2886507 RepID=UPI001D0F1442|nr:hypothetical protein [Hymenobacter translucens]MCC2546256.1 hypothetical protein [Hymenobacter translucens]
MFQRHLFATVCIGLYLMLWGYLIYWFSSGASSYPNSCGAANGGLIMLIFLCSILYLIVLTLKVLLSKGQNKEDYVKLFCVNFSPVAVVGLYLIFS